MWARRVVWKNISLYCLFPPKCTCNKSWSAVQRKGDAWHGCLSSLWGDFTSSPLKMKASAHPQNSHQRSSCTVFVFWFCACKNVTIKHRVSHRIISFHMFNFFCQFISAHLQKNANKPPFSSPCSFIYISYYLGATAVVNIVSACVVMCCCASVSFSDAPVLHSSFVMSVSVSHSSTPALEGWCSVSFAYCAFDVWPVAPLPLCWWYHVIVFLVISVLFMAF